MSAEKLFAIKQSLISSAKQAYILLLQTINNFPQHAFQQQQSLIRFDEGMMWLEQAIMNSPLEYKNLDVESLNAGQQDVAPANEPLADSTGLNTEVHSVAELTPSEPEAA